jgi:antitoxin CcdA
MQQLYNSAAARRAVNISLNSDLVTRARSAGLNLSSIAEAAIGRALAEEVKRRFDEEIARSLAEYKEYLAEYGSFADAVLAMDSNSES